MRSSPAPTISSLLHSCPGLATYWRMCKCCVTYLLTYLLTFVTHEKQQSILVTEQAVVAVHQWFILNGLQLNPDKTESMFLGTSYNLSSVSDCKTLHLSGSDVNLSDHIKSLDASTIYHRSSRIFTGYPSVNVSTLKLDT